ncbi:MAG: D-alanyl-D-alanine carboxypeptidase/D-alanyl-D-alanine-endopeptidase [Pedobacter sp.]|nr:MAG: D-alanyl-D-alanine carboxypeptidase/D-alanyl-D-alanine-endopeptidase [Pedobacter sp.]
MRITLLIALAVSCLIANGQSKADKLQQAYAQLKKDPQAKYAITSICVLDAASGKVLFSDNENIGVAPASTLKTITAATALAVLGKDYTYKTTLSYTGSIADDGTLNGNVVITGSGDPTLASWRYERTKEGNILNQWVTAIRNAGIKKINGSVVGNDSAWPTQSTPEGWIWQDIGNYYGAGASAINWRENQFDIKLRPGKSVGDKVDALRTVPSMPFIQLVNELKTGTQGTGDNAYAFLAPYTNIAYLRGSWGIGIAKDGIAASVPDPAFDVASRLQDTLSRIGVTASMPPATARTLGLAGKEMQAVTSTLNTITSVPLSELVYWFNKKSVNLYGEALIKTLAGHLGKPATTRNGASTVVKYWTEKGIDADALNIVDGSGLSPGTRVTASAMATILFQAQKEVWYPEYIASFPDNNGMQLKSGSINDVSAYAGYYKDSAGNKYVIVININNYNGSGISRKLFKVLDALK